MEHLEKLSKVMRYAGLNLTPQVLSVLLDKNVIKLVQTLDDRLKKNPNLELEVIDEIVDTISKAIEAEQKEEALKQESKSKGKKALEKA